MNDQRALVDVFGKLIMSPSIPFRLVVFYEFVRRLAVTSTCLLLMIIYKYTKHDGYLQKQTIDLDKIIKKAKLWRLGEIALFLSLGPNEIT